MAAKTIKGITVEIGGNTVGLQKALGDVDKKSRELNTELRQVNNGLKLDPTNTTLLAQKQQLLSEQVKNTSDKLQQLKSVQSQVEEQYKNGDIGAEAYRAFQRELASTESKLASLEQEEKNVGKASNEAKDGTARFSEALNGLKSAGDATVTAMGSVASAVTGVMTATVEGAVEAGKAAAGVGMSFESSVSQLAATMGKSSDQITDLSDKAKELGATTQFSASQAAEGLNILAMSGLTAEEQTAAVGDVLNLAAAGNLSLAQAASYTTGTIKGFGDSMDNAQKYTDLMAKGATLANTDVNGLGAALAASAATAKSYGQNADGVTLALLRLAEQNVTGSEAATTMNRAMADLYTPSDAAKKALEELGVAAYDQAGNARDFNTVIDDLNTSMAGMSEEQQNAYKNTIFTTNGLNAFNKMTASSTEKVNALRDGLSKAGGSAGTQAETMIDNLQGDMTKMQSAAEGLGIAFYETFNDDLRDSVQLATASLGTLTDAFKEGGIEGAADAAGKIIVDLAKKAADMVPTLIEAGSTLYSSMAAALTESAPELATIAGDIVTVLADGIAQNTDTILTAVTSIGDIILAQLPTILDDLISSAGSFATSIVDFFTRTVSIVGKRLPNVLSVLGDSLSETLPTLTESFFTLITTTVNTVLRLLPAVLAQGIPLIMEIVTSMIPQLIDAVMLIAQSIVDAAPNIISLLASFIPLILRNVLSAVLSQAPNLIEGVLELVESLTESLPFIITVVVGMVPEIISAVVNTVATFLPVILKTGLQLFSALVGDMPRIVNAVVAAMPELIESVVSALLDALPILIECGVELFLALVDALPDIIRGIQAVIPEIIGGIKDAILQLHGDIVTAGSELLLKLVEKLPEVIDKIKQKTATIVDGIAEALRSKISTLVDVGKNLVEGIWQGINDAKDWLIDMIFDWCGSITDSIMEFFGIHSPSTLYHDIIGENLALGVGDGFTDKMEDVTDDMIDAMPTSLDVAPALSLVSGDSRLQTAAPIVTANTVQTPAAAGTAAVYFAMNIENFNNSYGTSVDDLMNAFSTAAFSFVQRTKLAG